MYNTTYYPVILTTKMFRKINLLSFFKEHYLLVFSIFLLLIFWWPTITTPYWWDSAGLVIMGAHQLIETNSWPLLIGLKGAYAHPTLFITMVALSWSVFGHTLLTSHSINLFFSLLVVIYIYKLGQLLAEDQRIGKLIATVSIVLLLFTPVFYAQLGIIYLEIPMTALALMTVYYYLKKSLIKYLLSASFMLLIKEVSVVIIFAILFLTVLKFFSSKKRGSKSLFKDIFIYSLPLLVIIIWFVYHKIVAGFWFIPPGSIKNFSLELALKNLWLVIRFLFLDQWRFILSIFLLYFIQDLYFKTSLRKYLDLEKIVLFLLIEVLAVLLFGFSDFLPRYIIFLLPFFYLLTFYFLVILLRQLSFKRITIVLVIIAGVLSFLFHSSWDLHRQFKSFYFPPIEDNLEYLDIIALGKQITNYIATTYPDKTVYTTFPNNYMLSEIYQGYTVTPINVKDCKEYKDGDKVDLMIIHFFSPNQLYCARMTQLLEFDKALKFERNGKVMYLYINGEPKATPSAVMQINN
jgi:hypothetical protein